MTIVYFMVFKDKSRFYTFTWINQEEYELKWTNGGDCVCRSGAVVAEGGRVTIDGSKLDASNLLQKVPEPLRKDHHVLYRVVSLPRHGALSIRGHNLTRCFAHFLVSH